MHAIVIYTDGGETARQAAVVASELGARSVRFDRRPDVAMYDLVVLVLSRWGLLDASVGAWLALGGARGKALALAGESPAACALGPLSAVAGTLGGAALEPAPLALVRWGIPPTSASEADVRAWARALAERHPPPGFPRGNPGKRSMRL